ncbi:Zn-dependent hydrolase [Bacillus sp. FJAT-50079]|uniref:Zn-dependent hydrolase n=1 Tax=Bacillus sp. FJAT-50079 TaxID=2833577 RepID=UPI001BC9DFFB|nr:Zn-dependent hydrolase [Bacillus sp. FJAT-50079]MBS4208513.1 Zn-dependent hydrolase [Bacillus sp. FJAT-50079]
MSGLSIESKEFKQILHNLHLENMSLPVELHQKIIEIVQNKQEITPELIRGLVRK